jgi:hypothetical protein
MALIQLSRPGSISLHQLAMLRLIAKRRDPPQPMELAAD